MDTIKLHPVRTNEYRNQWLKWPRSKQVLASMLLWATRANATLITFDPAREKALVYSNPENDDIETELPHPPQDVVESYLGYLRDIASEQGRIRMFRKPAEPENTEDVAVRIQVPDIETEETYFWIMTVGEFSARFESEQGVVPAVAT